MAADNARVLKRGRASRVVAVALAGRDLVIKHFPVRGALDRVLGNLRGSRARRSWRNACALMRAGIATPMPLAVVEKRKALWRLDSYLIMEYVPGIRGRELFDSEEIAEHEKQLALQRIVQLFGKLARARISHGDMKDTNIIFSNGQTHLLDLDALRRMRGARLRRALGRDIRRWLKNWNHQPELQRLFRQTLAERGTLSSVKGIEA
jgi:tRNA A-37 threonylcarbamoyl transferase component Bud32